jgi:hypothetical protein
MDSIKGRIEKITISNFDVQEGLEGFGYERLP